MKKIKNKTRFFIYFSYTKYIIQYFSKKSYAFNKTHKIFAQDNR